MDRQIEHANPQDYGITSQEATAMRLRYINGLRDEQTTIVQKWRVFWLNNQNNWFIEWQYKENLNKLEVLNKQLYFIKNQQKDKMKPFDMMFIKSIPINTIVKVDRNNKFKVRNEKTASCHWYKDSNTWVDFGGDNKRHDVIDLVMHIYNLSFVEACKKLSDCS